MKRYILTGAPGAGKTVLLRALERAGHPVVEEAATDINLLAHAEGEARPHLTPSFIDDIPALQLTRQRRADTWAYPVVVFDRSPICTLALSTFLDRAPTLALTQALERIERERIYERRVLFIENLGHCEPTAVRRISFEDSLRFEAVHRDVYARLGYDCVSIPAADVASRLQQAVAVIDG